MSEPYIGEIRAFGFSFVPQGWLPCDGQSLSIEDNASLFALLGNTYGGDGKSTFKLPDLRGRTGIHQGQGNGLSKRVLGENSGQEKTVLSETNLPSHSHGVVVEAHCVSGPGNTNVSQGNIWSKDAGGASVTYSTLAADAKMAAGAVSVTENSVGANQPFEHMPPNLALNYCIAVIGIFPPRS